MSDYLESNRAIDEGWIRSHLRILYRHRLPAGAVLGAAVLAAAAYVYTATPIFEGRTQLLIQVQTPEAIQFRETDQEQLTTDDYQTQYGILRSRALARRTLDGLKLWDHEEFRGRPGRLSRMLGQDAEVPGAAAEETSQQTRVINAFLRRLSVEPVTNSRLVDVAFRSADPKLAAQVANTLSQNYIDQNVEGRFQTSRSAAEWLEEQLSQQRGRLEKGQQSLQRYRERNPGAGADNAANIVTQKLADLNAAVTRAETQRIEKQAAFERLNSIRNDQAALDTVPAVLGNPFIQALKTELAGLERQRQEMSQRLGERHPDMVKLNPAIESARARLQSEIGKVVQSVENEYLAAQANEQRLLTELAAQQRTAVAQDRRAVDFDVIQREVTTNQQLFDSLMQRAKELGIAGEFKSTNVRIIDQAEVPSRPVWPARAQTLAVALILGAMMAFGTAVGIERLDSRIKSPAEIPTHLGLPYLGLIPELPQDFLATGAPLVNKNAPPSLINAFEDLSTGLILKTDLDAPRIVLVCSSGPSEGKTLVASNLALAIAELDQRVVLLDVDMHRPRVHEMFGLTKEPGLTDVLAGQAKLGAAVRRSPVKGLWVMTAGQSPEHSAAFLGGGPHFRELLAALAGQFDWIVIDSPPVLAVADSTLIAKDVTGVVFVVNTQTTGRDAARVAIERLDTAGARFFGAVLNRADIARHERYFDPYYRKEYSAYYGREQQGGLSPARPAAAPPAGHDAAAPPARDRQTGGRQRLRPLPARAQAAERNN
jgi:capsular exopolysaccharide synthesis family protein